MEASPERQSSIGRFPKAPIAFFFPVVRVPCNAFAAIFSHNVAKAHCRLWHTTAHYGTQKTHAHIEINTDAQTMSNSRTCLVLAVLGSFGGA